MRAGQQSLSRLLLHGLLHGKTFFSSKWPSYASESWILTGRTALGPTSAPAATQDYFFDDPVGGVAVVGAIDFFEAFADGLL